MGFIYFGLILVLLGAASAMYGVGTLKRPAATVDYKVPLLNWRAAKNDETYDVWVVAGPEYGVNAGKQRGVASWRMKADGTERRDDEVEWVLSVGGWHPARTDLEPGRIVVFDGLLVQMGGVPAGGRALGRLGPP